MFEDLIYCINNEINIREDEWFNRIEYKKYQYESNENKVGSLNKSLYDLHKDLYTSDGLLASIYEIDKPSDDFLTGCFIARMLSEHLNPNEYFQTYLAGMTDTGVNAGINYFMKRFQKSWIHYGTNIQYRKPIPLNYLNGNQRTGDLSDINTVISINMQLIEKTNNLISIIYDVRPKTVHMLYLAFVLMLNLSQSGLGIIRLPNLDDVSNLHMKNFLILILGFFNKVSILSAAWCKYPKYYIVFRESKIVRKDRFRNRIIKYVEFLKENPNTYLFTEACIKKNKDIDKYWPPVFNNIKNITSDEVDSEWIDFLDIKS